MAAKTSSWVRTGYSARKASSDMPLASVSSMSETQVRVPLMLGLRPQICGASTIRAKRSFKGCYIAPVTMGQASPLGNPQGMGRNHRLQRQRAVEMRKQRAAARGFVAQHLAQLGGVDLQEQEAG